MIYPVDVLNMLRKFERTCMFAGLKEEADDLATIFSSVSELIEVASLRVYNVNSRWYVVHNDQPKTAWSNIPHMSENEAAREKDEALKAVLARVGGVA